MLRIRLAVLLSLFVRPGLCADQDATIPGELRTDSMPNSISIEWDLSGDSGHDATCNVQYRQQGSEKWLEALPWFRVDYQWWHRTERAEKPLNMFAGSLILLEPETSYQLRLDLVRSRRREGDQERYPSLLGPFQDSQRKAEPSTSYRERAADWGLPTIPFKDCLSPKNSQSPAASFCSTAVTTASLNSRGQVSLACTLRGNLPGMAKLPSLPSG